MINSRRVEAKEIILVIQMMHDFFAEFAYPFDAIVREKQVRDVLENSEYGTVYVCQTDNQIIGYQFIANTYSFEFGGKIAYLDEYYILPEARQKGAGKYFLQKLQEKLKKEGFTSLRLEVENYNTRAVHLYQTNGFSIHPSRFLMTCSFENET